MKYSCFDSCSRSPGGRRGRFFAHDRLRFRRCERVSREHPEPLLDRQVVFPGVGRGYRAPIANCVTGQQGEQVDVRCLQRVKRPRRSHYLSQGEGGLYHGAPP